MFTVKIERFSRELDQPHFARSPLHFKLDIANAAFLFENLHVVPANRRINEDEQNCDFTDHLFSLIAVQRDETVVDFENDSVGDTADDQSVGARLKSFRESLFALAQGIFGSLPLRDIVYDELYEPLSLPVETHSTNFYRNVTAIPAAKRSINLCHRYPVCHHTFQKVAAVVQMLRRQEIDEVPPDQVVRLGAEHSQHRGVRQMNRPVGVDDHHTVRRQIGQGPVTFFAVADRRLGGLAFRNIDHRPCDPHGCSALVVKLSALIVDVYVNAVSSPESVFLRPVSGVTRHEVFKPRPDS